MPRLPSSLKWLIDRRGRVAGEIRKVERELAKCQRVIDSYEELNKDLAALRKLLEAVDKGKIEQELAQCQRVINTHKGLTRDLVKLKRLLGSVDLTLSLHDVQVQQELIPAIRSQEVDVRFPHGLLSRTIFEGFRTAGKRIVSSREITSFVVNRLEYLGYSHQIPHGNLARRLKCCLQTLYYNGHLVRHHDPKTHKGHGLWSLVERDFTLSTRNLGGGPGSSL